MARGAEARRRAVALGSYNSWGAPGPAARSSEWTFSALLLPFIGGVGTVAGRLLGAAFYVLPKEVLAVRLVETYLLISGALFVLVVLVLPGGLLEAVHKLPRLRRRG